MIADKQNSSPIGPKLTDGIYELLLIKCIHRHRSAFEKPCLVLVFKEPKTGTELTRTINIPSFDHRSLSRATPANSILSLILGIEDTLELRRKPTELVQKILAYGGGRLFSAYVQKNEKGFLDILTLGDFGGSR